MSRRGGGVYGVTRDSSRNTKILQLFWRSGQFVFPGPELNDLQNTHFPMPFLAFPKIKYGQSSSTQYPQNSPGTKETDPLFTTDSRRVSMTVTHSVFDQFSASVHPINKCGSPGSHWMLRPCPIPHSSVDSALLSWAGTRATHGNTLRHTEGSTIASHRMRHTGCETLRVAPLVQVGALCHPISIAQGRTM